MFEQVIEVLKRFNQDPVWVAFKQENGTIPLGPVATNECVNPLYKLQAESLLSCVPYLLRGEYTPSDWEALDAGTRGAIEKAIAEQFKQAGFPLVKIRAFGGEFTTIRTAHGLLLAE